MITKYPETWPEFYTATIHEWKYLLKDDNFKEIIIESLQWMVQNKKVKISAFVIMSNHIHLIWQATTSITPAEVQTSFKKYTSKRFLYLLNKSGKAQQYIVQAADRQHQFWKRNSLRIELFTPSVFEQKLEYIHDNPVNAGLCKYPEEYKYSSAKFYETGFDSFDILER